MRVGAIRRVQGLLGRAVRQSADASDELAWASVNLNAVAHFKPYDERRLAITLSDGSVVVASRAASEELRRLAR